MKKIFLISIFLLMIFPQYFVGQTLHTIIFANTKCQPDPNKPGDVGIGPSVTVDFQRIGLEVNSIAKSIGYNLKKYYYYDTPTSFSRTSLDNVLNNLNCENNDIVFFYYSGHGGRAGNEPTDYPEMALKVAYGPISNSELYPLYDVYLRIKRKSPRLTIVMGDLCNSIIKYYFRNDKSNKGATVLSKGTCDVYKNLFLNVKGGIIVASSKAGETSGCYPETGGIMTSSFLNLLQYCVNEEKNVSWDILMQATIDLTQESSEGAQHPIFQNDLVQTTSPNTHMNPTPNTPNPSNDQETNQHDELSYSLSMIANKNVPLLDRIHNISPTLSKYFENKQNRVQVVGCDDRTIVNTCSISEYMNYLSMATNMDQVVVLETTKNASGKVTYLKVHEIHYK